MPLTEPVPDTAGQTGTMPSAEMSRSRTSSGKVKPVFFENLDGLRFMACLLVFSQHAWAPLVYRITEPSGFLAWPLMKVFGSGGGLGVSFFFVLSGFLITFLILTEIKHTGRIDVISFYVRRILRIWPVYYLVLLVAIIVYPWSKTLFGYSAFIEIGDPFYYFVFLGNFDVISLGQGRGAVSTNITWSVAIEEQFYLIWPLLFSVTPARFFKYLFVVIIVGSTLFRAANAGNGMITYFHSFSVISDMAVGGLAAYLSITSAEFVGFLKNLTRKIIGLIYAVGFVIVLYSDCLCDSNPVCFAACHRLMCSLFFVFVILEQNYADFSFYKMSKFGCISKLGRYTYGLYLLHPIAIQACHVAIRLFPFSVTDVDKEILIAVGSTLLSLLLAFMSYHWYEQFFLRLKPRFSRV